MIDQRLKKVLVYGVKKINENKELIQFFKDKVGNEKRTSVFEIISQSGESITGGFAFDNGRFVYVDEATKIESPTVVFKTTEDIVWSLILGKMELEKAVYLGEVSVDGAYWLRDVALFTRAFKEFNHVFKALYK